MSKNYKQIYYLKKAPRNFRSNRNKNWKVLEGVEKTPKIEKQK